MAGIFFSDNDKDYLRVLISLFKKNALEIASSEIIALKTIIDKVNFFDEKSKSNFLKNIALQTFEAIHLKVCKNFEERLEKSKDIIKILDQNEFPIHILIKTIDISQDAWLPKLKAYGQFSQDGICADLVHREFQKINDQAYYTLLAKLVLIPEDCFPHVMDKLLNEYQKLSNLIQNPPKFDSKLPLGSTGQLSNFLANTRNRTELGLSSSSNLIDYGKQFYLKPGGMCSAFFNRASLLEQLENLKKSYQPGDRIKLDIWGLESDGKYYGHSMGLEFSSSESMPNGTIIRFNDPNGKHGIVPYHSFNELINGIKAARANCEGRKIRESESLPLQIRVYTTQKPNENDINNYSVNSIFDKEKLVNTAKLEGKINECLPNGLTPLMLATQHGDLATIKLLVKAGAKKNILLHSLNDPDLSPVSVLTEAVCRGYIDIIEFYLKEKCNINLGYSPLKEAADRNRLSSAQCLMRNIRAKLDEKNHLSPAIESATSKGYQEIKDYLISCRNNTDYIILIESIEKNDIVKVKLVRENYGEKNFNTADVNGMTPLMFAAKAGNLEMVKLLIQYNAEPNTKDKNGQTALIHASIGKHSDIVDYLLQEKSLQVDASIEDIYSLKAIDYFNLDFLAPTPSNLINHEQKTQHKKQEDEIPLIRAAKNGDLGMMEFLISQKVPLNIRDNLGKTALMHAAENSHVNIVNCLLDNNADLSIEDNEGNTVLDYHIHSSEDMTVTINLVQRKIEKNKLDDKKRKHEMGNFQSGSTLFESSQLPKIPHIDPSHTRDQDNVLTKWNI